MISVGSPENDYRCRGVALMQRGLLVPAQDQFGRWLSVAEESGDPGAIIPPLNALVAVADGRGQPEAAWEYLQRALTWCAVAGASRAEVLRAFLNGIQVATETGRFAEAQAYAEKAAVLDPDEDPALGATYWLHRATLSLRQHQWMPAQLAANRAYLLAQQIGDEILRTRALMNRGTASLELGAYPSAEQDLRLALEHATHVEPAVLAATFAELGRLHYLREEYTHAMAAGRQALDTLLTGVALLDKEEVARVSRLFGAIFAKAGQRNLALTYLNRAAAYFSQLGLQGEWRRSTEVIGEVLAEPMRPGRSHLRSEIQQLDFLTAVLDLTDDLESVDPYLRGHSDRVAALAVVLGRELGLPGEELITLNHAARLADVGMIAVETELLHRPGPLTEGELRQVARHSAISVEMLRPHVFPASGLAAIRHHHEHVDGTGYPDGLKGDEIPLLARVIALADVYDSLTSVRYHRGALSHEAAMGELCRMAGRKLDPALVERFTRLHQV